MGNNSRTPLMELHELGTFDDQFGNAFDIDSDELSPKSSHPKYLLTIPRKWVHFTTMFINLLSLTFICVALGARGWYHGDYYETFNGTTVTANTVGSSKFHCTLDIGLLHSTCTTDYRKDLNSTSVLYLFASDDDKYNFRQSVVQFDNTGSAKDVGNTVSAVIAVSLVLVVFELIADVVILMKQDRGYATKTLLTCTGVSLLVWFFTTVAWVRYVDQGGGWDPQLTSQLEYNYCLPMTIVVWLLHFLNPPLYFLLAKDRVGSLKDPRARSSQRFAEPLLTSPQDRVLAPMPSPHHRTSSPENMIPLETTPRRGLFSQQISSSNGSADGRRSPGLNSSFRSDGSRSSKDPRLSELPRPKSSVGMQHELPDEQHEMDLAMSYKPPKDREDGIKHAMQSALGNVTAAPRPNGMR